MKKWKIDDSRIEETLSTDSDRFVANWLLDRDLSPEAKSVLNKGREIYRFYFENLGQLPTIKFKIESWDAGWWHLRNALSSVDLAKELFTEIKPLHSDLREKILPQIESFGFL
ncbi:MAG: hypothetical protein ACRD6X_15250 [Pyrinomonadaceae bacterium]